VVRECANSRTPLLNVSEWLEYLASIGVTPQDLPVCQPLFHKLIWERMKPGDGPDKLTEVIEAIKKENHRFHLEGGSWTSNMSWVRGYDSVMKPMEAASSHFYTKVIEPKISTADPRYRKALFYLLAAETSCYRYWGEGIWTDYGRELCRRADAIVTHDF